MNYSDFQLTPQSEKIGLVVLHNSILARGWTLNSGTIYKLPLTRVVYSVEDSGVSLISVSSLGGVVANTYYWDRQAGILYVRTSDSVNPNTKFVVIECQFFFSNVSIHLPHDLASGFDVNWRGLLNGTSDFGFELDNQNQFGLALEGSGSVNFVNDKDFWSPVYDKLTFENKKCLVYSYSRNLPITEAKLLYRGVVEKKSWSDNSVKLTLKDALNEIRANVPCDNLEDLLGARVSELDLLTKQRKIYGRVWGHVPSNIDSLVNKTYPLTGTATATSASATVSGVGTSFLSELNPGDRIVFSFDATEYTIESIANNTTLELSEEYEGGSDSGSIEVIPEISKRYMNRIHLVAGHSLKQPSTTVSASNSLRFVDVVNSSDFRADDRITVGSESTRILRVSGNRIFFSPFLVTPPLVGAVITRIAVSDVYLDDKTLVYNRDYTVNATDAKININPLAEFNIAQVRSITGLVTFTNASRTVTGLGTIFDMELRPSDWVRAVGHADYFEVLSIDSPFQITLKSVSTYTDTASARYKSPNYYTEGKSVLSCDCLGKTINGLTSGSLILTASDIVKDVLLSVGISASDIDSASFLLSQELASQDVALVIPHKVKDKKTPTARDVINKVNQSVFGSLIQTNDFKFKYNVLSPKRGCGIEKYDERDILSFKINSDSSRIIKTAKVNYLQKEYNSKSFASSFLQASAVTKSGTYLVKTNREYELDSILTDPAAAQILANRLAFILSVASSEVNIQTKMKGSRLEINDKVQLSHEKLYERLGSTDKKKIAAVQSVKKSISDSNFDLEDLANTFTRCGVITENSNPDYNSSTEDERATAGYITDQFGMQDNDPDTFGVSLIF